MDEFTFVTNQILNAKRPEDVFNEKDEIRKTYLRLSKLVHPDGKTDPEMAEQAFKKLGELYNLGLGKIRNGTFGLTEPIFTLKHGKQSISAFRKGISTSFGAIYDGEIDGEKVFIELSHTGNSDWLAHGTKITKKVAEGNPRYFPRIVTMMKAKNRVVVVFQALENLSSLQQVRDAYPKGVHPRTAAWMWNRILEGLGWIHKAGEIHGSILPNHVLIEPESHSAIIMGFGAVNADKLEVMDPNYHEFYPSERSVTPATDIYMSAKTIMSVSSEIPRRMRLFIQSCLTLNPKTRPNDAWEVRGKFDEVLKTVFGERKYYQFDMPRKDK